ncbi:MAG TPA: helix-turn-helix domain-containing protein, partial [Acidimicrobiales bacterium]
MTDRIRALRAARGLSQRDLSERAGVSRQLVGAVEAGRHVPNVRAALALARALEVPVERLFG